jgi:hypothetical protein
MILYKYVVPDRIDVLKNGLIRFTQANELNDPYDVNPNFLEFIRGSIQYAEERFKGEMPTEAEIQEYAQREAARFRERLYLDYLILSLAKRNNNLLMWAHYAACHQGLVFGFDENHRFFRSTGLTSGLLPVEYSKERFVLPKAQDWKDDTDVQPAFLRKSSDWAYEEEMRVLARSRGTSSLIKGPQGAAIYLFGFGKDSVREVIFGIQTEEAVKKEVIDLVNTHYPHVKLFQSKLNDNSFDLDVVPYQI